MALRSFPKEPIFADQSEREVWNELMRQLPDEVVIICNLKILEHDQEYEIDFIIAWPEVGIAVLEVKGGEVTPNVDSTFKQRDSRSSRVIDPIRQVSRNQYALKRFLEAKTSLQHVGVRTGLVFPYSDIPSIYGRPNIPREIVHDSVDLVTLGSRIERDLLSTHFRPSALEIFAALKSLGQAIDSQRSLSELGIERDDALDQLTAQQFHVLDLCKAMPRFAILGAAGCGKTYVAIEQARRKSKQSQKVIFLCYNRGLSEYLKRKFQTFPLDEQAALVATLHSLPYKWDFKFDVREDDRFWDVDLPKLLADNLKSLDVNEKFDVVIIDEAQDFHPQWWDVVMGLLKDPDKGSIYAFGDLRQGIFRHATDIPLVPAAIHLDINLRNSVEIAELASLCVEDQLNIAGLDGPPVILHETDSKSAISVAERVISNLITDGWNESDICLLTTGSRHEKQKQLVAGSSKLAYWDSFFELEGVFYGHVLGFKGLERRVIVLAVNGWKHESAKKDMLYTAITRARDLLVICGDPEDLRQAGGKEFLKKLKRVQPGDDQS